MVMSMHMVATVRQLVHIFCIARYSSDLKHAHEWVWTFYCTTMMWKPDGQYKMPIKTFTILTYFNTLTMESNLIHIICF